MTPSLFTGILAEQTLVYKRFVTIAGGDRKFWTVAVSQCSRLHSRLISFAIVILDIAPSAQMYCFVFINRNCRCIPICFDFRLELEGFSMNLS